MTKLVKIGKVPGTVKEIAVDNGHNVRQICSAAGLNPSGFEVRINGTEVSLDAPTRNGDVILLLKKIKGNA